jgi:hypothetical protein
MENAKKYVFGTLASSAEVMIFWGMHYIEAKHFFYTMWGLWVSKDAELNVDFTNINLFIQDYIFEIYFQICAF